MTRTPRIARAALQAQWTRDPEMSLEPIPRSEATFRTLETGAGIARLLEAPPLDVEEPAVIAAADAFRLHLAVVQRRAAMAAARMDEARPPSTVAKQDQVLAEDPDRLRPIEGAR